MKVGFFTDSHYSSQEVTCGNRYNNRSLDKIKEAYQFFEKEGCELVVCLGDLIDKEDDHEKEKHNLKKVAEVIGHSLIKTVCVMGNHDGFAFTRQEFYKILENCTPVDLYLDGKLLLFLDACRFQSGKHYAPGDTDWKDTFFSDVEGLKQTLAASCEDVYIFLHQNLDKNIRSDHRVSNADAVNELIFRSGRVRAVFQGHFHEGQRSEHYGVPYITFPAMCENEKAYFVEDL